MKNVLLKFADKVLSKNEMKGLKGGSPYGNGCGGCSSPDSGGPFEPPSICTDWSPPGSSSPSCVCHTGGSCS